MDYSDTSAPVYTDIGDGIGRLVLNRPEKHNAMSFAMWKGIPGAVAKLDNDRNVRVIVVTSSTDKAFSAGADIAEIEDISKDPAKREANRIAIREAQRTLARAKKPTIAMIAGACIGGGCGLAIHCDMRIASRTAKFGITPARLGIIYPLSDTKQLIDLVGPSAAKLMLFTGRIFGAEEAQGIGLVDKVVDDHELAVAVDTLAHDISAVSQYSVRGMKEFIRRVLDGQTDDDAETAEIFNEAHGLADAQEGVKAFLDKRPPVFKWND